jgi:hypothetical protein
MPRHPPRRHRRVRPSNGGFYRFYPTGSGGWRVYRYTAWPAPRQPGGRLSLADRRICHPPVFIQNGLPEGRKAAMTRFARHLEHHTIVNPFPAS